MTRARALKLSDDLSLPLDAVTEPIGMFANRGKGKSNGAHRFVEQLYYAGLPSVVLDVKGDWYGIRSSADGRSAGLPFLIVGGSHGDVPLEPGSGAQWARLVAEQRIPTIFDLSHFSKTQARKWVMEFAEELYRVNTEPLMVVVDEADVLIPQRLAAELMRLLGAMEDIAKRGRQRGLGLLVISQRVADVNKSVTDLLETLFLFAITGTRTRKAALEWIDDHADPEEAKAVIATLSSLDPGQCWVWSPGWLKLLRQFRWLRPDTFDSHATPKAGEKPRAIKTMAELDLSAIKEQMADTIERAKADDPKELQRRIVQLEKENRKLRTATPPAPEPETVETPIVDETTLQRLEELAHRYDEAVADAIRTVGGVLQPVLEGIDELRVRARTLSAGTAQRPPERRVMQRESAARSTPAAPAPRPAVTAVAADPSAVNAPRQKILDALAWYASVGVNPVKRTHLAFVAGTSPASSGFEKNLGALRMAGLVDYPAGGMVTLTAAGEALAHPGAEISTTDDLIEVLASKLGKPKGKILRALVEVHPKAISRDELAEMIDVSPASSGFEKNIGSLRSLGYVEYPGPSMVVASDSLFLP